MSRIRLPISPKSTFLAGTALKNTVVVILSIWFEFVVVVAVAAETEATTTIFSFHCLTEDACIETVPHLCCPLERDLSPTHGQLCFMVILFTVVAAEWGCHELRIRTLGYAFFRHDSQPGPEITAYMKDHRRRGRSDFNIHRNASFIHIPYFFIAFHSFSFPLG